LPLLPIATTASQLATRVEPLGPDATCENVRDVFVADPGLFALPIVDDSQVPVGLVNRFKFLERLSSPLGRELVIKKPVSAYMEPRPLVVDARTTLDELGQRLLDAQHRHVFDGFIVTRQGKYLGLGTGLDLVRALAERRHQELARLALHDMLTGLPNRTLFEQRLSEAIASATATDGMALLFIDLDRFKQINDTYGHRFGDLVLCAVSQRMRSALRRTDLVARLSGDEFAIILPQLPSPDDADALARALVNCCSAPLSVDGEDIVVTCSIGVALYPQHADSQEALVRAADRAQYHAKEARNSWQRYSADIHASSAGLPAIGMLRHGLAAEQLDVHYQPLCALPGLQIHGVEALVRWTHAGQPVPAIEVVRLAEESGLGMALTEYILRRTIRDAQRWDALRPSRLRVSVNVSAMQIHDRGLVAMIDRVLAETEWDPCRLDLELTERAAMRSSALTHSTLHALRARGLTLTLDDFGVGYSALSRLDQLPIDAVKIDKSFLDQVHERGDSVITRAIIAMARALGMRVIGEGVETAKQLAFLTQEGCDSAQGYLLGRPMPAEQLTALLTSAAQDVE
jgi:diguanylate cyclase (GGDEF)-like protein